MKKLNAMAIGAALCFGLGAAKAATPGDYSPEVTPAVLAALADITVAAGGNILASFADATVMFTGHNAGFSNSLFQVNFGSSAIFNNYGSSLGDTAVISGLTVGDPIPFTLTVDPDTTFAGDEYILSTGTSFAKVLFLGGLDYIVGFEDTRTIDDSIWGTTGPYYKAGGDLDYNDFTFKVTVPEPSTYAMFFAGLGVIGFLARRRRARF